MNNKPGNPQTPYRPPTRKHVVVDLVHEAASELLRLSDQMRAQDSIDAWAAENDATEALTKLRTALDASNGDRP